VYGTVEIKTTLTKAELRKSLVANRKIRDMAESGGKFYRLNSFQENEKGQRIAKFIPVKSDTPPRFFIFAYSNDTELETLKQNFIELSLETRAHCHGLCVLDKDWFVARNAYDTNAQGQPEVAVAIAANGFAVFISTLSLNLNSMQILQADLGRYEQAKITAAHAGQKRLSDGQVPSRRRHRLDNRRLGVMLIGYASTWFFRRFSKWRQSAAIARLFHAGPRFRN
jgi:hypothetical protein